MALTLPNTSLVTGQDLPIDLSNHRSSSPQVTISMGHNRLLEKTMAAASVLQQQDAEDLRVPSFSSMPLKRHSLQLPVNLTRDEVKVRERKRRLEETVDMLKVQKKEVEEMGGVNVEEISGNEEANYVDGETGAAPQLLQHLLLLQQKECSPLLYLQYCALLQSLQLRQALRQQYPSGCSPPPSLHQVPINGDINDDHNHQQQALDLQEDHEDHSPSSSPSAASSSTSGTCVPLGHSGSRRRAPRTLTGKHVKQGQGASPETMRTLKALVLERARLRALGLLPAPTGRTKRNCKKSSKRPK